MDRRTFLQHSAASTALVLPAMTTLGQDPARLPFTLGVASGEPTSRGFTIWTRLAPDPLHGGGMPPRPVKVDFLVANDPECKKVVRRGQQIATPQLAHSVHVDLRGLQPETDYWYRFDFNGASSSIGHVRTCPPPDSESANLRFAFTSCQHFEDGLYGGFRHMAEQNLDLIVHLGDYIYEGAARKFRVRRHVGGELHTLDEYRNRYAQYRLDPDLQAAHASCPWLVTWDDHEVDDDYAGAISQDDGVSPEAFLARRANAYQAFYEHMPLRQSTVPRGPWMPIYRTIQFGRLAQFVMLDTRQYRTDQPNGDGLKPLDGEALSPTATILGKRQERWLQSQLVRSTSRWNVLAQQVLMARVDRIPGPVDLYTMDKWSGYEIERRRLMAFLHERKIPNPIVLTGDIHTNFVNDLWLDADDASSPVLGTELVGTSITSGGNGKEKLAYSDGMMEENPFIKFHNAERGYVSCQVTPEEWLTDFKVLADVKDRETQVIDRARFAITAGAPGAKRV